MKPLLAALKSIFKDSVRVTLDLYKVMIPVILVVKLLKELDLIQYPAALLSPFMQMVGLPAETGLVWATGMLVNLYSAVMVYAVLPGDIGVLTVGQVTILAVMLLIAHNLPVELKIAKKCGTSLLGQFLIRIGAALLCGLLLKLFFSGLDILQEPARMLFQPDTVSAETSRITALLIWAKDQVVNLASIFLIILWIMTGMAVLKKLRITDLAVFLLRPAMRVTGIGKSASTITVIGLVLGIAYGGGLIIHEIRSGRVGKEDIFASMTLMGLSHALIEDTVLMLLIGADMLGIFWFRLIFSIAVTAVLSRLYLRWFFHRESAATISEAES